MEIFDKEKRQQRKADRQQKRDEKLGSQISTEAGKYGIDFDDLPKTPETYLSKANVDTGIDKAYDQKYTQEIEGFSKASEMPNYLQQTELDKEKLKKQLRKQKRAKVSDILVGLGRGLQGKDIDPTKFKTARLQQERDKQYENFRSIAEANKATAEKWEAKYRDDLINFLEKKEKEQGGLSDLDKAKLDKIKAETKWIKNRPYAKGRGSSKTQPIYTHQTDEGNWKMTNQRNPYSDLYYKLAGTSPTIINEFAKASGFGIDDEGELKRNLTSDEKEQLSNNLLSMAYKTVIDESGNRIAVPIPGKEDFIQNLSHSIENINSLKKKKKQLENQRDDELRAETGWFSAGEKEKINKRYDKLLLKIQQGIEEGDGELKSILGGNSPQQQTPQPTTSPAVQGTKFLKGINDWKELTNKK